MKKQLTTFAALLLTANFAMANSNSSQGSMTSSFNSVQSAIEKVASASNASTNFLDGSGKAIENLRKTIEGEATQELRKASPLHSVAGSISAVGAFTVVSVEVIVKGTKAVTKIVFQGLQSGSTFVVEKTEKYVAAPLANGVDSSAQASVDGTKLVGRKIWNTGTGVIIGVSASGVVLAEEMTKASGQLSHGQILGSSATILGSVSLSSQALGSKVVEGYKKD